MENQLNSTGRCFVSEFKYCWLWENCSRRYII